MPLWKMGAATDIEEFVGIWIWIPLGIEAL